MRWVFAGLSARNKAAAVTKHTVCSDDDVDKNITFKHLVDMKCIFHRFTP